MVGRGFDLEVAGAGPGEDEKGRVVWRECFFFFGGGGILVTPLCFRGEAVVMVDEVTQAL